MCILKPKIKYTWSQESILTIYVLWRSFYLLLPQIVFDDKNERTIYSELAHRECIHTPVVFCFNGEIYKKTSLRLLIYVHVRPLGQVIMQRHEGRRHITKVHKNYVRKKQEKLTEAEKHLSRKLLTTAMGVHLTGLYICEMGPGKRLLISKHIGMHHTITGSVLF